MSPHGSITLYEQVQPDLYQECVVVSEHMRSVMHLVQQIAKYNANVLIYGESGTGKELLARVIHQASGRRDRPFIPVNCGTLSGDLFESKLFGHEVGAFTGATRQTKGRFEQADQGTLFLDEVSEISPPSQVSFLRVLEDGWFRRLGGERPIRVDVRIVAATNKDLAAEVKAGRFRKDLYYRLQVIPINLLPLRERREAIPHFVSHLLDRFATLYQKDPVSVSPQVMDYLMANDWPGNIRQLKNFLERVFLTVNKNVIELSDLSPDFLAGLTPGLEVGAPLHTGGARVETVPLGPGGVEPLWQARRRVERELILRALHQAGGNRTQAAQMLQIKPRTLRKKMSEYEIRFTRKRGPAAKETGNEH